MLILVADDGHKIASFIANGLKQEGHVPLVVDNGQDAFDQLAVRPFDVAVPDIMMSGMNGLTVIRRLRAEGVKTPVLLLSAKRHVEDRVEGLRTG